MGKETLERLAKGDMQIEVEYAVYKWLEGIIRISPDHKNLYFRSIPTKTGIVIRNNSELLTFAKYHLSKL